MSESNLLKSKIKKISFSCIGPFWSSIISDMEKATTLSAGKFQMNSMGEKMHTNQTYNKKIIILGISQI